MHVVTYCKHKIDNYLSVFLLHMVFDLLKSFFTKFAVVRQSHMFMTTKVIFQLLLANTTNSIFMTRITCRANAASET